MSSKYAAYPEYKDSGVNFLNQVPISWEFKKVNYLFSFGRGLNITKADLEDNGIPVVNYGEVHSKYGFEVNPDIHDLRKVNERYLKTTPSALLNAGDFVFADTSEDLEGAGNFTQYVGSVPLFAGYHTVVLRPYDGNVPRYLAYAFESSECRSQIRLAVKGVKVFSITQGILKDLMLPIPSWEEQQKIAVFLDYETARIDRLIEKQQRLIELLKEKRQAVISHAVTKGLNPDAPMKDSGVEWLGQVPEHWSIAKLSYRYEVLLGKMLDEKKITGEFLGRYLRNTDVQWGKINTFNLPVMDFRPTEVDRYTVKKGDLIVCEGGEIGRSAIWLNDEPCFYQKALHRLRPYCSKQDLSSFMFYVMFDAVHQERFSGGISKATIAHLPAETFRQYRFAYPPYSEQVAIVEYLEKMGNKFDNLELAVRSQVELLKERRSALISAAVTGKIDVRGWTKPQEG
ncbi:restriction endonuclease subunit S [Shewanella sp. A3A]|nr:restriction endonuclease subunit S [Shewanella ferrihydritica]